MRPLLRRVLSCYGAVNCARPLHLAAFKTEVHWQWQVDAFQVHASVTLELSNIANHRWTLNNSWFALH